MIIDIEANISNQKMREILTALLNGAGGSKFLAAFLYLNMEEFTEWLPDEIITNLINRLTENKARGRGAHGDRTKQPKFIPMPEIERKS